MIEMFQVLIPQTIFDTVRDSVINEEKETGFFLIGYKNPVLSEIIVLDIIEYDYVERSSSFILSNPEQKILLYNSLPIGVKVIGNLHSHPFVEDQVSLIPSLTDLRTYQNYGEGVFGLMDGKGDLSFFTVNDQIHKISFQIVDDSYIGSIFSVTKIDNFKALIDSRLNDWQIISLVHSELIEKVSLLYRNSKIFIEENRITINKPRWLDLIKSDSILPIPYRVFYFNREEIRSKIETLFGKKRFELRSTDGGSLGNNFNKTELYIYFYDQ